MEAIKTIEREKRERRERERRGKVGNKERFVSVNAWRNYN